MNSGSPEMNWSIVLAALSDAEASSLRFEMLKVLCNQTIHFPFICRKESMFIIVQAHQYSHYGALIDQS